MKSISEIDKNFKVISKVERENVEWHEVTEDGFSVYGLYKPSIYDGEKPEFVRLPTEIAKATSEGVLGLYRNTAGGRVRFTTDSPVVAIRHGGYQTFFSHMPMTGTSGYDIYITEDGKTSYKDSFVPPMSKLGEKIVYEAEHDFGTACERDITINFPLYCDVDFVQIGLIKGSKISCSPKYKIDKPIVFYGSSITQGGCASRPGNSYQGFLCRSLDADHINLGFSGNACGESVMAEYIASLEMSAFVYDYDYNAPDVEHLKKTHYPFYKIIRAAHPDIPIICLSHPAFESADEPDHRHLAVEASVNKARAEGDRNIYFISGEEIFGTDARDCCTVDGCHPNDLGFYSMAKALEPLLKELLTD